MSYLYRTGNSRNNIAFTNTANSSTKYLRRTSTGRNNIVWTTIPQGSTYNILQRNGTGRNNILWSNLKIAGSNDPIAQSNISGTFTLRRSNEKGFSVQAYTNRHTFNSKSSTVVTYGTTLNNMYYFINTATVNPPAYKINFPQVTSYPANFESLCNRIYLYEDDNNYFIFLTPNISINYNSGYKFYSISVNDWTYGAYKCKGHYEDNTPYTISMLQSLWDGNYTTIKVIFYHWS